MKAILLCRACSQIFTCTLEFLQGLVLNELILWSLLRNYVYVKLVQAYASLLISNCMGCACLKSCYLLIFMFKRTKWEKEINNFTPCTC